MVSLNDRSYQVMIDPTVDLTEVDYPLWGVPNWILSLAAKQQGENESRPLTREGRMQAIVLALKTYSAEHIDNNSHEEILRGVNAKRGSAPLQYGRRGRLIIAD